MEVFVLTNEFIKALDVVCNQTCILIKNDALLNDSGVETITNENLGTFKCRYDENVKKSTLDKFNFNNFTAMLYVKTNIEIKKGWTVDVYGKTFSIQDVKVMRAEDNSITHCECVL